MQAVIVIPELSVLRNYADAEDVLTRGIAGVPLLIRVIATAMRAGGFAPANLAAGRRPVHVESLRGIPATARSANRPRGSAL